MRVRLGAEGRPTLYLEARQLSNNQFAFHVRLHFVGLHVVSTHFMVGECATHTMASC